MRYLILVIFAAVLAALWLDAPFFADRAVPEGALPPTSRWEALQSLLLVGRAGQLIAGIAVAMLGALLLLEVSDQRAWARRRRVVFGGLLLAILYVFPFFAHLGFWAPDESDWAEATTTVSAMRQTIAAGQFPHWNPYLCGGAPGFANPQTYALPFALPLSFLVGDVVAVKAEIILVIVLGFLGMFWLCRTLGLTGAPALLASGIFLSSGFTTAHLANGQVLWLTLAYVPWIVGAFVRSFVRPWWSVVAAALLVLVFVEGRVYLVAYMAIFLVVLAFAVGVRDRTLGPLRSLLIVGTLTVLLSAWKLLPALAFLSETGVTLPNNIGLPLQALDDAFLGRDLTSNVDVSFGAHSIARHEIAAYVGILPLVLSLAALRRSTVRRALPFVATGAAFLILSMQTGQTSLLEYLPLTRELRNPSRMTSMVVFSVALLSGLGLAGINTQLRRSRFARRTSAIPPVVAVIVLADLLFLGWTHFSSTFRISPQVVADLPPGFFQTKLPERQPANGYPTVAAGYGAKDFCPAVLQAFQPKRTVRAREDLSYRGEIYALGRAQLTDVIITPNVITARIEAKSTDTIVVNQNFARGWNAQPYLARNEDGLLGVDVPAGSSKLVLRYRTPYLRTGVALSSVTGFTLGALWLRSRRRSVNGFHKREHAPR